MYILRNVFNKSSKVLSKIQLEEINKNLKFSSKKHYMGLRPSSASKMRNNGNEDLVGAYVEEII